MNIGINFPFVNDFPAIHGLSLTFDLDTFSRSMNAPPPSDEILRVSHLSIHPGGATDAGELVHDVTFSVHRGEVLVLLGDSGSGKTMTSRAITSLFPATRPMHLSGSVLFEGRSILNLPEDELLPIRRNKIRYVFQDPANSLNPLLKVGTQLRLASDPPQDRGSLAEILKRVGIEDPAEVLRLYPHQLSGGMAQRICLAMSILPDPSLLITDEPTSSVDASLKYGLLDLLRSLQKERGMTLLLITHDLDIARSYGDRIIVMYGGRIMESASVPDLFKEPLHPYTRMLIRPQLASARGSADLIEEDAVGFVESHGCRFVSRCPLREERCYQSEPELEETVSGREVRCFFWK